MRNFLFDDEEINHHPRDGEIEHTKTKEKDACGQLILDDFFLYQPLDHTRNDRFTDDSAREKLWHMETFVRCCAIHGTSIANSDCAHTRT